MKVSIVIEGETVELTKQEEIEQDCHLENIKKFTQTNNTPPILDRLVEELGFLGISDAYDRILEGNYTLLNETDKYTKDLLKVLARPN